MEEIDILLVEDNDGDVRMVERAFSERNLPGTLHVVKTGDEALEWLFPPEETEPPRPDLVILDLNLPAISGHALLSEIKDDDSLKRTPVVILTSSQSDADLVRVYEEHANVCLRKPVDPVEFADRIEALVEFWTATATLPPTDDD